MDCFIPKLKYEDSENIKTDRVNTVVLTYIKSNRGTFLGTPGSTGAESGKDQCKSVEEMRDLDNTEKFTLQVFSV